MSKVVFDISGELNPGVWFSWDKDDPESAQVCVRIMSVKALQAIHKQTRVKRVEIKQVGREIRRFEFIDFKNDEAEDLEQTLIWDYCIVDWKGFVDASGKEIICNTENKKLLVDNSPEFVGFVSMCQNKIRGVKEKEEEEQEKNLLTT